MKTYFYCKTDKYGQRTGYVESIELKNNEITYNFHIKERSNKTYKGIFLYENKHEADIASLR